MPPFPHIPLAWLIACSFAAISAVPAAAGAATVPLRIDPALLGRPAKAPAQTPVGGEPAVALPVPSSPDDAGTTLAEPAAAALPDKTGTQDGKDKKDKTTDKTAGEPAATDRQPEKAGASTARPQAAQTTQSRATPSVSSTPSAAIGTVPAASTAEPGSRPALTLPMSQVDGKNRLAVPLPPRRDPKSGLLMASGLSLPTGHGDEALPAFLRADRIDGLNEQEMVGEGNVELRKGGTVLTADRLTYWPVEDETEAVGNVVMTKGEDEIRGPRARLTIGDQVGFFENPEYRLKREPVVGGVPEYEYDQFAFITRPSQPSRHVTEAHGQASRIELEGENQVTLNNATYSTCKVGQVDWWAQAERMKLDYDTEVGEAWDSKVMFLGVPIFYTPWMTFSLNNQRQSGILAPTFGSTSKGGLELTVPYYWNIAPNMDATIAPRLLTKRGVQLNTEFRYLQPSYVGQARVEYLPDDRVRREDRYGYSLEHMQQILPGLTGTLNLNGVSDDYYYTDLSSRITNTSQSQLLREGRLNLNTGSWFDANAIVSTYQTLQPDPKNPVDKPYSLRPQVNFNARKFDFFQSDMLFFGQATDFSHPTKIEGSRWIGYPQISMPFVQPGWYVTPKAGVHMTRYSLNQQNTQLEEQITRTMPILSVDSGMFFERPSSWFGREMTQTLEPRLYYLFIPYRDQDAIPLFDTAVADFNFAQAFSENGFTGQDRINDANQVTMAITSRLLDSDSGGEILKGMIGQRYYFETPRVTLNPTDLKSDRVTSDFLAAFSGHVLPHVTVNTAWQYNVDTGHTQRFAVGGRYQPGYGRVLNVSYRLDRGSIKQIDLSGQWPVYRGLYAVGRYNYDFETSRLIEGIGGLEYNAGCWVARFVIQRFEATAGQPSTSAFIQLELNDFSQIGSNPLDLLRRSIQGYGKINQPVADPVFGAD